MKGSAGRSAYFEEAIGIQPDFAEAHADLAFAQLQFLYGGPLSPHESIPKAEAAARKALQLDDTLAPGAFGAGSDPSPLSLAAGGGAQGIGPCGRMGARPRSTHRLSRVPSAGVGGSMRLSRRLNADASSTRYR